MHASQEEWRQMLIVALHGGSGHGRDFLWTWLVEARTRGAILLSPSSLDSTWSLMGRDLDSGNVAAMVERISQRWHFALLLDYSPSSCGRTTLGTPGPRPRTWARLVPSRRVDIQVESGHLPIPNPVAPFTRLRGPDFLL